MDDLVDVWRNTNDRIRLNGDGTYQLVSGNQPPQNGTWTLRGNLILTPDPLADETPANLAFHLIECDGTSVSLRHISISERNIPFTPASSTVGLSAFRALGPYTACCTCINQMESKFPVRYGDVHSLDRLRLHRTRQDLLTDPRQHRIGQDGIDHTASAFQLGATLGDELDYLVAPT